MAQSSSALSFCSRSRCKIIPEITRLIPGGFSATDPNSEYLLNMFARLGGDPARIYRLPEPRTTSEDALYSAALFKPKPSESWPLVTLALHMPRAVGCFRTAGFHVEPVPAEFRTDRMATIFINFAPGVGALQQFDTATKEWIGLVTYRLMGKTAALLPGP